MNYDEIYIDCLENNIKILRPVTAEDFKKYFRLRWEILRKPWNQDEGSERDDLENVSFHFMAVDEEGEVMGVCRLHFINEDGSQVRYMAVQLPMQGKGIGDLLLKTAENFARTSGKQYIMLQARENAVGFYEKQGYQTRGKTFLLYNEIQHYLMEKSLL